MPSRVAAIQRFTGWMNPTLDVLDGLPRVALVPAPVQILGGLAELDDEIAGQVLRLGLAALFAPEAQQGGFVVAHDDAGVGAADEGSPASEES